MKFLKNYIFYLSKLIVRKIKALGVPLFICASFTLSPLIEPLTKSASAQNMVYSPSIRPLSPSAAVTSIAQSALPRCNQIRSCLNAIHFSIGPYFRGVASDSLLRPPRTASDALTAASDCSDRVNAVISIINELNRLNPSLNLQVAVKIIHFDRSPTNVFHTYLEINDGSRRLIFDPSSENLGSLAFLGRFRLIRTLTSDQFEYLFHKEWGDYFLSQNDSLRAVLAYERSLEFYSSDPNLHLNLAAAYSNLGRFSEASQHRSIAQSLRR
jgi:tetratricopeptide (TPR) repeat protein